VGISELLSTININYIVKKIYENLRSNSNVTLYYPNYSATHDFHVVLWRL
jgi:hypothetical protein